MNINKITKKMLEQNDGELPGDWKVEKSRGQLRVSHKAKKGIRLAEKQRLKALRKNKEESDG